MVFCMQVMSVKALGIALKLTFEGNNQLIYPETWFFTMVVITCVIMQMNYLNKVRIASHICCPNNVEVVCYRFIIVLGDLVLRNVTSVGLLIIIRLKLESILFLAK